MELKRHQSDLTETAKRALATNRGLQSETLKSKYETLESDFKAKCHTMNAEQLRFVRLIKTKLPAIKVHDETESTLGHPAPRFSPQMERKTALLPPLVVEPSHKVLGRKRSKSFSDLPQAVRKQEQLVKMTRQKSFEQLQGAKEEIEQTQVMGNRPRSCSNIEQPWNVHAKFEREEENKRFFGTPRKQSSPAKLSPLDITDRTHETRKLTSKKPLGQQLEDVKDLRYLRTGKYSSETTVTEHGKQITGMKIL